MAGNPVIAERLTHILEWGERIGRYTEGMDLDTFLYDLKTQDAVIRCLEVIGEAAGAILKADPDFETKHPCLCRLPGAQPDRARLWIGRAGNGLDIGTVACPAMLAEVRRLASDPSY